MPNIALVEDEPEAADVLASFIARYAGEKGLELTVTRFGNAMDFEMTHQHFDLVFMDIQMPGINGMEAAQLMRTYDSETPIIFVTNLAQYAVKGYEVDALDFIVKPVTYFNFRMRMDKAMRRIRRNASRSIAIGTRDGMRVVALSDIEYVEVSKHDLSYHLVDEEEPLVVYGSLVAFEQQVDGVKCVHVIARHPKARHRDVLHHHVEHHVDHDDQRRHHDHHRVVDLQEAVLLHALDEERVGKCVDQQGEEPEARSTLQKGRGIAGIGPEGAEGTLRGR